MFTEPTFSLWPIAPFGAEDGDGTGGAGSGAGDSGAVTGGGGNGGNGNSAQGGAGGGDGKGGAGAGAAGDGDDDDDDEFAGLSPAEIKALAKQKAKEAKDAEKARKAAQAKIDEEERKKNDKATNLEKDLEKANTTIATLRATVNKQAIEAAIRDDDRWSWHDVEMVASVAAQLNSDGITVNDEGKVEGLKATLPKVAKQHPFLVKSTKGEEGDGKNNGNNGGTQQNNGSGPTGFQPGQGGTSGGSGQEIDNKALAENYPALAGRI